MKRLIPFLLSAAMLAVLYWLIDVRTLGKALAATDLWKLSLSLVLLMALLLLTGVRLMNLARTAGMTLSGWVAIKATLLANSLNLFLPGKLGDLAKVTLLRGAQGSSVLPALYLIIFEKLTDVVAVFACGAVALMMVPGDHVIQTALFAGLAIGLVVTMLWDAPLRLGLAVADRVAPGVAGHARRLADPWRVMSATLRRAPVPLTMFLGLTLLIWAGHFVQIAMMAWALGVTGPWAPLMAVFPLVILAGIVPMTIAGIGPRDAAMVFLAGPLIGADVAAALSILFLLRYLVPGLPGLALMGEYGRSIRRQPS
jgi:glycosyltransferase 2 family protein